jgi:hypothetical protein
LRAWGSAYWDNEVGVAVSGNVHQRRGRKNVRINKHVVLYNTRLSIAQCSQYSVGQCSAM